MDDIVAINTGLAEACGCSFERMHSGNTFSWRLAGGSWLGYVSYDGGLAEFIFIGLDFTCELADPLMVEKVKEFVGSYG